MVDVQRDKYWTNEKGRFCVNLRILFPSVGAFPTTDAVAEISNPTNFQVHERLGRLATGDDYWWELRRRWLVSESRDVDRLASDLRDKWLAFGKPWFQNLPDLRSARDYMAAGWGNGMAIPMSLALGEPVEARELFIDSLCLRHRPTEDVLALQAKRQLISESEAVTLRHLLMQHEDVLRRGLEKLFGRSQPRSRPTRST